jgi:hypothetical protein
MGSLILNPYSLVAIKHFPDGNAQQMFRWHNYSLQIMIAHHEFSFQFRSTKRYYFGPKTINMNVFFLIRMSGSNSPISGDNGSFEMRDWAQKRIADYDAMP